MRSLLFRFILTVAFVSTAFIEFGEARGLPKLRCGVVQSAGSFHSFIQPKIGDTIVIDLNDLNSLVTRGAIHFSSGSYITIHGQPNFSLERIDRGSHDSGGWRIHSLSSWRSLRVDIMGEHTAWIIDEELQNSNAISLAAMSCKVLN